MAFPSFSFHRPAAGSLAVALGSSVSASHVVGKTISTFIDVRRKTNEYGDRAGFRQFALYITTYASAPSHQATTHFDHVHLRCESLKKTCVSY
jgi:pyridoxine 5'-phosphate synthase PdxJ